MTVIADRVREVSNSSSTGPMTLEGTVVGFRRFRDAIADGATVPYVIENGAEWEVGYGSFTAPATLNRVTVLSSSNSNSKVDFSAGQKSIWVDAVADYLSNSVVTGVSSVNGRSGAVTLTKSDVGLANVDNTSDANKPVSIATQTALNLKVDSSLLGATSGVATLDSGGKLTSSQIPDIAIVAYLGAVASQAAMLALTGQQGDWCIRSDLGTTWIITGANPAVIGGWTQLSYPTAPVTSVNTKTGAVTLNASDVGAQATVTVSGIVKGNGAGTLSAAVSGTDYAPATSGSAILKGNGAGGFSSASAGTDYQAPIGTISGLAKGNGANALTAAVAGTDYAPATSGGAILKGNNSGGFASAVAGADYLAPPAGSAILKANAGGGLANAVSGTDYAPATSGSAILKGNGAGGFASATAGTDYAVPTSGTSILSGNGSGGFSNVTIGSGLSFAGGTLSNSSAMTYPGAGMAVSTGSAWGTSKTAPTGTVVGTSDTQTLTNKTLTAAGSNTVEATSGPTSTQLSGNRNKIINGAMMIDQRNAGASVTPTNNSYTLDRYGVSISQSSKFTVQQNAGAITPPSGYSKYLGVTSSSAYSVLSGDFFSLWQRVEGSNIFDFAWGTASAYTVTLSFKVYSSLTGTFGGSLVNGAGNRSYPFLYTVSSTNTWTQISVVIPGDTSGTWASDNSTGVQVNFCLGAGSGNLATAGSWQATNVVGATGSVSVVGTNGATFYITGVQLEKGATATPFENRLYGTELALCQRYAFILRGNVGNPGYARSPIFGTSTTSALWYPIYPVTLRDVPSLITSNFTSSNVEMYNYNSASGPILTSVSLAEGSTNSGQVGFNASGGGFSAGAVASWRWTGTPNAYIGFSAEL